MPKVSPEYIEEKKKEILQAAWAVSKNKAMYDIGMRDIIREGNFSQGLVYRYYANIDAIFIDLINRNCQVFAVEEAMDKLLKSDDSGETLLYKWLLLWKKLVFDNLLGVGKIYFELTTVYANDKKRAENFTNSILFARQEKVLQQYGMALLTQQIVTGYFSPKIPLEDIVSFLVVTLDGICRDVLLNKFYQVNVDFTENGQLNEETLFLTLALALIGLLEGDPQKISMEENTK